MKLLLLTFTLFGSNAWADSDNSWREQHNDALEQLKSHPSYMEFLEAQPSPTRAGMLRFLGDQWVNPEWTPLYLSRLESPSTPPEVRYALIDLMARSGGNYVDGILELWPKEQDPKAKALMLDLVKRMTAEDAQKLFELAHGDNDPTVQEAFYRNLPRQSTVVQAVWLLDGLQSESPEVLEMAIRSAGWLQMEAAFEPLQKSLKSTSPLIRLRALRALERIDANATAQLKSVKNLTQDTDPKVARAATQITSP